MTGALQGIDVMRSQTVLILLMSVDALVIGTFAALHVADYNGRIETVPDLFKINARESVGTLLLFLKFLLGALVLYRSDRAARTGWAKGLALVFFLLWFDDWAEVHEFFGDVMVELFGLTAVGGLDPDDIGEVIYLIPFAVVCFGLILRAWLRAGPDLRPEVARLFATLALLAAFGVGGDLLAQAVRHLASERLVDGALLARVVEDGGEMVAGSLMLWQAVRIAERLRPPMAVRPV